MRRKLLLILPALQQARDRDVRVIKYARFPPLSLLTLAGMTPDDRYDITVRDEHVESVELDEDFDLVGIQVYISSAWRAYELAARYRARGAKVVLGGLHASSLPEEAAQHADTVVVGPAESVWDEVLRDFEAGRLRPLYRGRAQGSAARVPPPRRDLMNRGAYLIRNTMVASRGCPHDCSFCYKSSFWGQGYYEGRPLASLERELDAVDDGLVFFLDDNLLSNRRFCRGLFDVLRGRGIVWQAAGSLDVTRDAAYLDAAHAAGCRSTFIGLESLSHHSLRSANKPVNTTGDYFEAIRRVHGSGIMVNGSFVFGLEDDGPDVFERTLEFAMQAQLETGTFHINTPFPGTPMFAAMEAEGRLLHRDWSLYDTDHAVFRPRLMTAGQLEAGHRGIWRDFVRFGSILRRIAALPGPLKRLAYNLGWTRVDPLWSPLVRFGLMPFAREIFTRVLRMESRPPAALARTGGVP